jgi:hypothetical protein
MIGEHWFWGSLTIACVVWYSTITIYVAIKGAGDIKEMLARLSDDAAEGSSETR